MTNRTQLSLDLGDDLEIALKLFGFESKKVDGFFTPAEAAALAGKPRQRIHEAIQDGRLPLVEFTFRQDGRAALLGPYVAGTVLRHFMCQPVNRGGRPRKPQSGRVDRLLSELNAA